MIGPQQSQSKLVVYLIVLLGLVGGYMYSSNFATTEIEIPELPPESRDDDWKPLKGLNIDFSLLQKPEYQSLRTFGENPVNPGVRGKDDPFN